MNKHAVLHRADDPMAYPVGEDELEIILRSAREDLYGAAVVWGDRFNPIESDRSTAMRLFGQDELFDYWIARIKLASRRFRYYFVLDDGCERLCYGEGGFSKEPNDGGWDCWFFQYPYLWFHAGQDDPPEWAQDAVVYQIFVERFANGDESNDPAGVTRWGAKPTVSSFFGGDLQGILDHVDHLSRLGISCLYLTPIFLSPTNHKYDTSNYYLIDPHFGDAAIARRLVDECHARGIRVILDAVFNHCGYDFFAFQDVLRRGRGSRYLNWFNIGGPGAPGGPETPGAPETPGEFGVDAGPRVAYETFGNNIRQMPKLRTDNPEVQEYLVGVAEYWTRALNIDGWRLDVADEIDHRLLRKFRKSIRAIRPDALIVGEIMHDASAFLRGDQVDCLMNYPWRDLCVAFFARRSIGPKEFADRLTALRTRYRHQMDQAMWNLLDSHDRERFLTSCGGDRRRLFLASTFQFTYIGVPYVYYGDEVGLEGENDPDCRRCMPWDEALWNGEILNHYRALIWLRRQHQALRRGEYATISAGPGGPTGTTGAPFAFARWDQDSCIIVLINNSDSAAMCDLGHLRSKMAAMDGLTRWADSTFQAIFRVGAQIAPGAQASLGAQVALGAQAPLCMQAPPSLLPPGSGSPAPGEFSEDPYNEEMPHSTRVSIPPVGAVVYEARSQEARI